MSDSVRSKLYSVVWIGARDMVKLAEVVTAKRWIEERKNGSDPLDRLLLSD